ncbi:MAG TPA: hypothetical protein VIM06_10365 [Rhodanobacter sp.]
MTKIIRLLAPVALLLFTSSAHAGWYEVKNYIGTIGAVSVHLSLQTYGDIDGGPTDHWRIGGSYYYDAHRIPIPLQGQQLVQGHRLPSGRVVLCEAVLPPVDPSTLNPWTPTVPARSAAHPAPCPISLGITGDGASGEWSDGKRTLPIMLHQVGSLNDTGGIAIPIDGVVEIPMWYHTKTYLLLGVYGSSEDCPVSMLHLRLVNIATGRIDGDIPFPCEAGMLMTPIYANVHGNPAVGKVTVGFDFGGNGCFEDVDIEPRKTRGKHSDCTQ